MCVGRKVFLKHQVNWDTVCGDIRGLPWRNIGLGDNPVEVLNKHLSLLVGRYVPTKVIRVRTRISLGLMINAGMLLPSIRSLIFSRVNWKEFVRCKVRAYETCSVTKRQFSDRNRDVLMNVHSLHKWWSTLKSAVFGSSSSLHPHVSEGGGLVGESVGKADLL